MFSKRETSWNTKDFSYVGFLREMLRTLKEDSYILHRAVANLSCDTRRWRFIPPFRPNMNSGSLNDLLFNKL
jgi:hypothetical protein